LFGQNINNAKLDLGHF
jgi:biopolymer transport protein ExbB/TolQ